MIVRLHIPQQLDPVSKNKKVHGRIVSQHQQQPAVPKEDQSHRKSHKAIVGHGHGKLCDTRNILRIFPQAGVAFAEKTVKVKKHQAQHESETEIRQDIRRQIQLANVVDDQTRIRKIDHKLVDAVIHFVIDKIDFSQKPSREQDREKHKISTVHRYTPAI